MIFGWILAVIGLVVVTVPRAFMWTAQQYRGVMPSPQDRSAVMPARVAGFALLVAGVVIALAA